jgi:hypothetical protein
MSNRTKRWDSCRRYVFMSNAPRRSRPAGFRKLFLHLAVAAKMQFPVQSEEHDLKAQRKVQHHRVDVSRAWARSD